MNLDHFKKEYLFFFALVSLFLSLTSLLNEKEIFEPLTGAMGNRGGVCVS